MVVTILGNPFAGKHTVAAALTPLVPMKVVTFTELRESIAASNTERAAVARTLIAEGSLLTDEMIGELLSEAVADQDVIIVGRPRNVGELDAFTRASGCLPSVVYLEAERALIEARMAARGLRPIEVEHPGALRRLGEALQPVLDRTREAGRLLTLDAALPVAELVARARVFVEQQRRISRRGIE